MTSASGAFGLPEALPFHFTVDREVCTVPDVPTRDLLDLYRQAHPLLLVPGLVEGGDRLAARMYDPDDDLDLADVERVALDVGGRIVGCPYWPAVRLVSAAAQQWMLFDGWCLQHSYSPLVEPFPRLVAAVYAWRLSLCQKKEEAQRLDAEVFAPVSLSITGRHVDADLDISDDQESAAFTAAFAAFNNSR